MIGVPWSDARTVGELIGVKTILNEFVAFRALADNMASPEALAPRSAVLASYALAGFANFGSIAMQIAGIGELAPSKRAMLAELGPRRTGRRGDRGAHDGRGRRHPPAVMSAAPGVGVRRELVVGGTLTLDTTERGDAVHEGIPGGSALYGAAGGSVLLPTRLVGMVGDDFPFHTLSTLWARGIDATTIDILPGPTFRWHARYGPDGNSRVTVSRAPGVAHERMPSVPPMAGRDHALLLGSTDPRVQSHVRDACPLASVVGLDSMAHWWTERPTVLRSLLARVHIVLLDEAELTLASGAAEPLDGARQLLALGPDIVVVKHGSRGAWMTRRDRAPLRTSVVPLASVADPTGAGDAFAGAFVAAVAAAPEQGDGYALRFATAVASFAVEGVGTRGFDVADLHLVQQRMTALSVTAA